MRAIGWDEVQLDASSRQGYPFPHELGVMITRVVQENMDERQHRIERLDDQAAAIDRGALSDAGAHPCFPGQRALSSRQARAGMVSPAGTTHQAALHPNLLPAFEPDRAVMGPHAQTRHAQQVLRNLRSICRCDARFPARKSSPELGQPMCCLLYTSDAADDLLCVDLGGRRIIKKKKKKKNTT